MESKKDNYTPLPTDDLFEFEDHLTRCGNEFADYVHEVQNKIDRVREFSSLTGIWYAEMKLSMLPVFQNMLEMKDSLINPYIRFIREKIRLVKSYHVSSNELEEYMEDAKQIAYGFSLKIQEAKDSISSMVQFSNLSVATYIEYQTMLKEYTSQVLANHKHLVGFINERHPNTKAWKEKIEILKSIYDSAERDLLAEIISTELDKDISSQSASIESKENALNALKSLTVNLKRTHMTLQNLDDIQEELRELRISDMIEKFNEEFTEWIKNLEKLKLYVVVAGEKLYQAEMMEAALSFDTYYRKNLDRCVKKGVNETLEARIKTLVLRKKNVSGTYLKFLEKDVEQKLNDLRSELN